MEGPRQTPQKPPETHWPPTRHIRCFGAGVADREAERTAMPLVDHHCACGRERDPHPPDLPAAPRLDRHLGIRAGRSQRRPRRRPLHHRGLRLRRPPRTRPRARRAPLRHHHARHHAPADRRPGAPVAHAGEAFGGDRHRHRRAAGQCRHRLDPDRRPRRPP